MLKKGICLALCLALLPFVFPAGADSSVPRGVWQLCYAEEGGQLLFSADPLDWMSEEEAVRYRELMDAFEKDNDREALDEAHLLYAPYHAFVQQLPVTNLFFYEGGLARMTQEQGSDMQMDAYLNYSYDWTSGSYIVNGNLFEMRNGMLYNITGSVLLVFQLVTGYSHPRPKAGDVNLDGAVDGRDALRLTRCLAGQDVTVDWEAADVNGDGAVDGRDALRLVRNLAGI